MRHVFFIVMILLFLTLVLLSSQLYRINVEAVANHEIFSLKTKQETDFALSQVNARNTTFQLSEDALHLSAERGPEDSPAIFNATVDVNIVFRPDLKLSVSMSTPQGDSNCTGEICFWLTNGTNTVILHYVLGFQVQDWTQGSYSHIYYEVGNNNMWMDNQRSMFADLLSKVSDFGSTRQLSIFKIEFGVISYSNTNGSRMEVIFNANATSLHYDQLAHDSVKTSSLNPNPLVASLMVIDVLSAVCLFVIFTILSRKWRG